MQNQSLLHLAKQSAKDARFMASLIQQQATREQASWEKMASLLNITEAQLARLALCQRPRDAFFAQDVGQIVGYSGINRVVLLHLLDCVNKGVRMTRRSQPTAAPKQQVRKKEPSLKSGNFFMRTRRAWAFGLAALLVLVLGAFVVAQSGKTEATLVVSAGEAMVSQAGGALLAGSVDTAVTPGDLLTVSEGDTIRLTEDGAAQLRLQDGSTVDLFGGTTVTVAELVMNDDTYRFQINLLNGKTLSRVVRLLRPNDAFEIRTPSSTASVRGTIFTIEVESQESSRILVEEGIVNVALVEGEAIDVPAGFQVSAAVGQPLQLQPNNRATATPTNTPTPRTNPTATSTATNTPTAVPSETATRPTQTAMPANADKVLICHYPAGDSTKGNTLEIAAEAVDAHLAHGDQLGACPTITPTSTPVSADTNTPVPGNTNTPVPANTNTPVPANTNTPVPANTDTPVPTATNTPEPANKVTLCHNGNTIEVNADAVDAHLAHGDTLGPCP